MASITPTAAATESVQATNATSATDSLSAALAADAIAQADSVAQMEQFAKENPLFSKLLINNYQGQLGYGPAVGAVSIRDTATVMGYLKLRQVKEVLPRDLGFRWTVKPVDEKGLYYQLVAIKITNRDGKAPLGGNVIVDARENLSQVSANYTVSMSMNPEGAKT